MNKLEDTKDTKNPLKWLVGKDKMNTNFHFHCFIIGWHSNSLCNNVPIILEQNISVENDFCGEGGGGKKYF